MDKQTSDAATCDSREVRCVGYGGALEIPMPATHKLGGLEIPMPAVHKLYGGALEIPMPATHKLYDD